MIAMSTGSSSSSQQPPTGFQPFTGQSSSSGLGSTSSSAQRLLQNGPSATALAPSGSTSAVQGKDDTLQCSNGLAAYDYIGSCHQKADDNIAVDDDDNNSTVRQVSRSRSQLKCAAGNSVVRL